MSDAGAVRWLLVGAGEIVRKRVGTALATAPGSKLTGVCARSKQAALDTARLFGAEQHFDDLTTALSESESDAVYIATPVQTHVEIARAVLQAGRHVLVEKPLGMTAAECESLLPLASQNGLSAGCAYYRRCLPRFLLTRELIGSGRIGIPLLVRMSYMSWYAPETTTWRTESASGGPLGDMGCHMFDLVSALLGRGRRVFAILSRRVHSYGADDSCAVIAEWENEVPVLANFHWSSKTWQHDLEITGTEGRIQWRPFDLGAISLQCGRETQEIAVDNPVNVHQPMIENFIAAIQQGREPVAPLQEAIEVNRILDAVRASIRSGSVAPI